MAQKNKIPRFDDAWRQNRRQIIDTAATESINFFKETFDRQGFTDVAFTPWEPKKRQDGYIKSCYEAVTYKDPFKFLISRKNISFSTRIWNMPNTIMKAPP